MLKLKLIQLVIHILDTTTVVDLLVAVVTPGRARVRRAGVRPAAERAVERRGPCDNTGGSFAKAPAAPPWYTLERVLYVLLCVTAGAAVAWPGRRYSTTAAVPASAADGVDPQDAHARASL